MACQTKRDTVTETHSNPRPASPPSRLGPGRVPVRVVDGNNPAVASWVPHPGLSQADGGFSLITTMPWSWPKKRESINTTLWAPASIALSRDVGVGSVLPEARGIYSGCRGSRPSCATLGLFLPSLGLACRDRGSADGLRHKQCPSPH